MYISSNIGAKIFKILTHIIQEYIKGILHHGQVGLIPRIQAWLNIQNSNKRNI